MTSTTKHIALHHSLLPPAKLDPEVLVVSSKAAPPSGEQVFPINTAPHSRSVTSDYYDAASAAVRDAQRVLNETLTVWKDAIGDREKAKEDLGQVAYGNGRSARMTGSVGRGTANHAMFRPVSAAEDDDEEGEDGENGDGVSEEGA